MVKYLIERPTAVLLIFFAALLLGLVLLKKIPLSLLPDSDVPQMLITVNYPNSPSIKIEKDVVAPIRESMLSMLNIKDVESRTSNHTAAIWLYFDYNTRMDLAYIEANEKIDHLLNILPSDVERPQVQRISINDVPILRIQVLPKDATEILELSALSVNILKRRIEQIKGVSIVDLNGLRRSRVRVIPNYNSLQALNVDEKVLIHTLQKANSPIGNISLKDNGYVYFMMVDNNLENVKEIAALPVRLPAGKVIPLGKLATLGIEEDEPSGYHIMNGREGIVITVQKQSEYRMDEVVRNIKALVRTFRSDYPEADFYVTQDQSFLLDAGINNLYQDIIYGGILTVALLFLFLGNWLSPSLMSISIPVSLIITCLCFYVFKVSFNIISLSGIALGIGMLIDNSIVVIDNIDRKLSSGLSIKDGCVQGVGEVVVPVVSQVLTTVAVYLPLVLLNGIAGKLLLDQSIALTISLLVSLLSAFVLAPVLFSILSKRFQYKRTNDTIIYLWISRGYHRMIDHVLKFKKIYLIISFSSMPLGILIALQLPVSGLPRIEKKEGIATIDWGEEISVSENLRRTRWLVSKINDICIVNEAEIGLKQFIMTNDLSRGTQITELYYAAKDESKKNAIDKALLKWTNIISKNANISIVDAPNAFTRLFYNTQPYLEAKFKYWSTDQRSSTYLIDSLLKGIRVPFQAGIGFLKQDFVNLSMDQSHMAIYDMDQLVVLNKLEEIFGKYIITDLRGTGSIQQIVMSGNSVPLESISLIKVLNHNGQPLPLSLFVNPVFDQKYKYFLGDRSGNYRSVYFDRMIKDPKNVMNKIRRVSESYGISTSFSGQYFDEKEQLKKLVMIFFIVLGLLYLILAIQYEDLLLPFLVMLTIPFGITGSVLLLSVFGYGIDIMGAIGFIVILGLIVDDPILKIETLKRLEKKYIFSEYNNYEARVLSSMIHEAGSICLKPLLLVSLTTSVAMIPILCFNGIGNDLQKPMALVIIGGLTIGTFFSTWFIPIIYWYYIKWRKK